MAHVLNHLPVTLTSPAPTASTTTASTSASLAHTASFRRLMAIDVSKHIEHKGGFAYLSWPFAVAQLRQADPDARWEVRRFDGLPYLATELGYFVEVAVTVQGVTLSQIHPVLDGRNRPIAAPTSFDINTSIQRCLVKAIALHGLGLSIYAGEDLVNLTDTGDATEPSEIPSSPPSKPASPKGVHPLRPVPPAPVKPNPPSAQGEFATVNQLRYMERLIDEAQIDIVALLDYFGYETLDRVPKADVDRVLKTIQSQRRVA
jgi:hypothetical protein